MLHIGRWGKEQSAPPVRSRWLARVLAVIASLTIALTGLLVPTSAFADVSGELTISAGKSVSYGGWSTNRFDVQDVNDPTMKGYGYCATPALATPPMGSRWRYREITDPTLRTTLYFAPGGRGWGGPNPLFYHKDVKPHVPGDDVFANLTNLGIDLENTSTASANLTPGFGEPFKPWSGMPSDAFDHDMILFHILLAVESGDRDPYHGLYGSDLDNMRYNIGKLQANRDKVIPAMKTINDVVHIFDNVDVPGGFKAFELIGTTDAGYQRIFGGWYRDFGAKVKVKKVAAQNPDYVAGNSAYSMEGIRYDLLKREADGRYVPVVPNTAGGPTSVTLGANGESNEIEIEQGGRVYAREALPMGGRGFKYNPAISAGTDVPNGTQGAATAVLAEDPPFTDPVRLLVQKTITGSDRAGKPQGNLTDLGGVKIRVDYYADLFNSVGAAERSGKKLASAVFQTDAQGNLNFQTANPVEGTWKYREDGENRIPLGTVVLTEVSAKPGLAVRGTPLAFKIEDSGRHDETTTRTPIGDWPRANVTAGAVGAFDNEIWKGGVGVCKADADSHTSKANPQGNGSLAGTRYDIINRSRNEVQVNGKFIPVGGVAMSITTQDTPQGVTATSGKSVLPYGTYDIVEVAPSNSYLKKDWQQRFTIDQKDQYVTFDECNENPIKRGGVEVVKADADSGLSEPQGDGDLAGVTYDIINRSTAPVFYKGAWYEVNAKVDTITTAWDANRKAFIATTGNNTLPYGKYDIVETGTPVSYHNAKWTKTFEITEQDQLQSYKDEASGYNKNQVRRGGIEVIKADADWHTSNAQGDATLAGVQYEIVNRSKNPVFVDGKRYTVGSVVKTIETVWDDAAKVYKAKTGDRDLPYGTYEVREVKASEGYLNAKWTKTFTIREDMTRNDGEVKFFDRPLDQAEKNPHYNWNENHVQRGGVIVGKIDRETGQYTPLGEATLAGAQFEIVNRSKQAVYVDGKTFQPGEVTKTITTEKMQWNGRTIYAAFTGDHSLPYGTYDIREVKTSKGYLYDSTSKAWSKQFKIRQDGQVIDFTSDDAKNPQAVSNQVIRMDFHFDKKDQETSAPLNNVPFLLRSRTTGEQHVIVTDENGTWASNRHAHTQNTNANDPTAPNTNGALKVDENGNWVVADASKLDADAGTWFAGLPTDQVTWDEGSRTYQVGGRTITVKDDKGAFPYDAYDLIELRAPNNENFGLINVPVRLYDAPANHDGAPIDREYGTLQDIPLWIDTTLSYDGGKVAPAVPNASLDDAIEYDGLPKHKTFVMRGELHKVKDGKDEGIVARAEKEFDSKFGFGEMSMTFSGFDTTKLGGYNLVAFETVVDKATGAVVGGHTDLADEDQTVTVPEIHTTLNGVIDHEGYGKAPKIILKDVVDYKGLEKGVTYTLSGVLMDRSTGKEVVDGAGKKVTATSQFTATDKNGTAEVTFEFEGVDMSGRTVVAFETVRKGDIPFAVHADINDEGQTVRFPDVHTKAGDKLDGLNELAAAPDQTVVDTVSLHNLTVGKEYTLTGEAHIQKVEDGKIVDGGVLKDANGRPFTGTTTFTATAADMEVKVEVTVDGSALQGETMVMFEELKRDNITVGIHAEITDIPQTMNVPDIHTTLKNKADGQQEIQLRKGEPTTVTLVDTVTYKKLIPGKEYTLTGELHLRDADGKDAGVVKDPADKAVTAEAKFTPKEPNGTVDVEFTFDAAQMGTKSVVAFEKLFRDGKLKATHADITDEGQTVNFVDAHTTATDGVTGTKVGTISPKEHHVVVDDALAYTNLKVGKTYTVKGELHLKDVDKDGNVVDGGVVKDVNGNVVTATKTFVADKANGTVSLTFDFVADLSLPGRSVVAFEKVYPDQSDRPIIVHADITDEDQTVPLPKIGTTATDTSTGTHILMQGDTGEIKDVVSYENLVPGKEYTVTGEVHKVTYDQDGNAQDGGALVDKEGKTVTASSTFTPKEANGTVDVVLTFPVSEELRGTDLVVYETLFFEGKPVTSHEEPGDKGQTVHIPKIGTTATDGVTGTHTGVASAKEATIKDAVAYWNLIPGKEYTVTGELHQRGESGEDAGVVKDAKGKKVTSTVTFTPEQANGTIDLTFTWTPAEDLSGKHIVAFEDMFYEDQDTPFLSHKDINDKGQTVDYPKVGTKAVDAKTSTHMVAEDIITTIADTVEYTNVTPGENYTVTGQLHVKHLDGKGKVVDEGVLKDEQGNPITAETHFIPQTPNGNAVVFFSFPAHLLAPGKTVVAFEDLKQGDVIVATHADIKDEDQSVHKVELHTTATGADGKSKTIAPSQETTIVDKVEYNNLVPGREYEVRGVLMDKSTGFAVVGADGKAVEAATKFVPKTANGTVELKFTFNSYVIAAGGQVVAFERLYDNGVLIGSHADINDEAQTVTISPEGVGSVTGEVMHRTQIFYLIAGGVLLAIAAGAGIWVYKRRNHTTD